MKMENGLIFLKEVDSTNNYLRRLLDTDAGIQEGLMVCAEYQTSGHGQVGNTWESEKCANLLFSMLFYPSSILPSEQFLISQATSLGIVDFLNSYCKLKEISIKWPNDIYWRDKKICGILIENFISGHFIENTIAGIGLNVNQVAFLGDAPNPISVKQISGLTYDIKDAAIAVRKFIFARYLQLLRSEKQQIRTDYFSLLYRKNGYHKYSDENGSFMARIDDVKETGILILVTEEGVRREYAFKKVEYQAES